LFGGGLDGRGKGAFEVIVIPFGVIRRSCFLKLFDRTVRGAVETAQAGPEAVPRVGKRRIAVYSMIGSIN
jgi:hypothetical protein